VSQEEREGRKGGYIWFGVGGTGKRHRKGLPAVKKNGKTANMASKFGGGTDKGGEKKKSVGIRARAGVRVMDRGRKGGF